ncbi:MAG: sulfatase-like hydrolase/transferase [Myxococcota bacterium]
MKRLCAALLLSACGEPEPVIDCKTLRQVDHDAVAAQGSNILIIMSDDIGIDKTRVYDAHPDPAPTPNIDALACAGVRFNHAYSNPTCSPTRASLMTGRHSTRTGLGKWIYLVNEDHDLRLSEITLPEMLADSPVDYATAAIGKWHLVGRQRQKHDGDSDPAMHPNLQGFEHYQGALGNPLEASGRLEGERGYTLWERVTNGVPEQMQTYMSTVTTDDALSHLETMPEPWLMYVAFNGAHAPLHVPPKHLHPTVQAAGISSDIKKFDAMVEATDAEIGRLVAGIPEDVLARTTIIYLSDNGTPAFGTASPWPVSRVKGTLYEGGVNIPLIVTGPLVDAPGRTSDALLHVVDIFPTLADLAEVPLEDLPVDAIDGVSFLPLLTDAAADPTRELVFVEKFEPNGPPPHEYHYRMVTDGEWKLIRYEENETITEELFYIPSDDWLDGINRIHHVGARARDTDAYARLSAAMDEQIAGLAYVAD